MTDVYNDINKAKKIILYGSMKNNEIFNENSYIYLTTNEQMNKYQKYVSNNDSILTVISSGDQIFNSILGHSFNIVGFDISCFPKYFYELKKAAILNISRDDFMKFFFQASYSDDEFRDDIYDIIKKDLDKNARIFWDELFSTFECYDIFSSKLFSEPSNGVNEIIERNDYLKDLNYNKLKSLINKTNLKLYDGDILSLSQKLKNNYDCVNLSNIINYVNNYKEILKNIPLNDNGLILTYLYEIDNKIKEEYNESNYHFDQFENSQSGVMIYKRKI